MRTSTMWFPNRSDTNQAVQAQNMARGLKFWITYRNCTILVAKTKVLMQNVGCSHSVAHILIYQKHHDNKNYIKKTTTTTTIPVLEKTTKKKNKKKEKKKEKKRLKPK